MAQISKINLGGIDYDVRDKVLEKEVANIKPIVNQGTINNAADEEDLTSENSLLKLKDRAAVSGKGYVILRKNKSFAEQVTQPNTIYEIRYDFELGNEAVTIPSNSVLKFVGGSISNGKINGNHTLIDSELVRIFHEVTFEGTYQNAQVFPQWFGAIGDNATDCSQAVQSAINCKIAKKIVLPFGEYRFEHSISLLGSGIEFETDANTKLYFYTQDSCVNVGIDSSTPFDASSVTGGIWQWKGVGARQDIFKIIYATHITFRNVNAYGGKNGFNCDNSDFVGMFYGNFDNCRAQWNAENGFNLMSPSNYGINAIRINSCQAGSNGHPEIGQHVSQKNEAYGNGIVCNGSSISVVGCSLEFNAGVGVMLSRDAYVNGCIISSCYFESNLGENIKVEKGGGYKSDILINTSYQYDSTCLIEYTQEEQRRYNISEQRSQSIYDIKEYSVTYNVDNDMLFPTVKLPSLVEIYTGEYKGLIQGFLACNIDGQKYRVCKAKETFQITSLDNGVVTLDKPVSSAHIGIYIVSEKTTASRFSKTILKRYPLPLQSLDDNPANKVISTIIPIGSNAFSIGNIEQSHGVLREGDVVYTVEKSAITLFEINTEVGQMYKLMATIPTLYASCSPELQNCMTFMPSLLSASKIDAIKVGYLPQRVCNSMVNIENASIITPSLNPAGMSGKIEGLQDNAFFSKGYAYNNNFRDGTIVEREGHTIKATNARVAYGIAACAKCVGNAQYVVSYNSDVECSMVYTLVGADGAILGGNVVSNSVIATTEDSAYLIVIVRPTVDVESLILTNVHIEEV